MISQRGGSVYIMTNKYNSVLYTGVTSDLRNRIWEHKNNIYPTSFTSRYNCNKLVYYSSFHHIEEAIAEEKRIKGSSRAFKKDLVVALNPNWKDLYEEICKE